MSTTDRELLELAAKAAGVDLEWQTDGWAYDLDTGFEWNPLTDDGDALRLAVKLKIDMMHTNIHAPQVHALADAKVQVLEEISTDPYGSTRRAIVGAAAAIGEAMK